MHKEATQHFVENCYATVCYRKHFVALCDDSQAESQKVLSGQIVASVALFCVRNGYCCATVPREKGFLEKLWLHHVKKMSAGGFA